MARLLGPTPVVAPDGVEWLVGRRWLTQRTARRWRRPRELASESLSSVGLPDLGAGSVDSAEGLLLVTLAAILVVLLVPILFFGVELVVVGGLLAAGLAGRLVSRQPWVIEARASGFPGAERRLEWQVRGWRASGRLIDIVVSDLAAGREPAPVAVDPGDRGVIDAPPPP
jgi:hypothetical protein